MLTGDKYKTDQVVKCVLNLKGLVTKVKSL